MNPAQVRPRPAAAAADAARRRLLALAAGSCALAWAAPARAAAPDDAQPAPDLVLPTLQGRVQLSRLPAKAVYLDFWASWCAPCRLSFPWMAELQVQFAARGLAVVAVNLDTRAADAESFLRGRPTPFTVAFDPRGDSARAYRVAAMPSSLLLAGGTLKVLHRHAGFRSSDTPALEAAVAAALA
jgi:thiol-disulfide isomerase/thioredoxin